jgi:hypothetical protein
MAAIRTIQFAPQMRRNGRKGTMIGFEPMPAAEGT